MDATALALVTASASSLVSLMTSEAWEQVKNGAASLFRRGDRPGAAPIEDELDESARELTLSIATGDRETQVELEQQWRGRLRRLLIEQPKLADELRSLLAEWSAIDDEGSAGRAHTIQQTATARDSGRVYQQGTGIQNNH
ncbi:hypothetical protein [Streptomyces xanthophaeus]